MKRILSIFFAILAILVAMPNDIQAESANINEEILYSITVDRYNNLDHERDKQVRLDDPMAYHGGDLKGIIDKLDSFEELGYTTLVLSPIMANAPDGYHGYWIEDFYSVEEQFGTMDDLHTLIKEAHKRNIKVVMELVTNYIADSHPIAQDTAKKDWVIENKKPQTNWSKNTVKLNQNNPEVQAYLLNVANYWMDETDIDGYKLHAADQASSEFLNTLSKKIKAKDDDFYILADILDPETDITHLKENKLLDAIENYSLYNRMTEVFAEAGKPVSDIYGAWQQTDQASMIFVDNKSTERFTQTLAENGRNALTTWSLALTYMYTIPGVPVLYQGSELPMYGSGLAEAQQMVKFNSGDPDLTEFHNRISSLRNKFPVLTHGDFEMVGSDGAMSVFKRSYQDETMYIAINNDEHSRAVSISDLESGKQLRGYLGDNTVRENDKGEYKIGLARETAEVFAVENDTGYNWLFIGFIIGVFLLFIIAVMILSRKQKQRKSK
ncbi:MAG: alpha-amylase family glycosyl hydrolase [Bacillota bacterium]